MNIVRLLLIDDELHSKVYEEYDKTIQKLITVKKYYVNYLTSKNYTDVEARITLDRIGMKYKLHGFSAKEYINDPLFNCDKYKFGTRYHDLRKTSNLNKTITNNFEFMEQSFSEIYNLMMGDISSYEVERYENSSRCSMNITPFTFYLIDHKFYLYTDEKYLEHDHIKNNYKKVD